MEIRNWNNMQPAWVLHPNDFAFYLGGREKSFFLVLPCLKHPFLNEKFTYNYNIYKPAFSLVLIHLDFRTSLSKLLKQSSF